MSVDDLPASNLEGPFTFTTSTNVVLRITDAACRGDRFEVFDFRVSVGTTSSVPVDPECDDLPHLDAPEAFLDPSYSHGTFLLGPGSHAVTIDAIVPSRFSGGAGLRVDSFSKSDCKKGGWRNFPGFKNQGACVSFVATGGRSRPPGSEGRGAL